MSDHYTKEELKEREQAIKEREMQLRMRELEAEIREKAEVSVEQPPFGDTPDQPMESASAVKRRWHKIMFYGKLIALGGAAAVMVILASWLAGILIIAGLIYFTYVLFFQSDRKKK